jgi:hypothetical protein
VVLSFAESVGGQCTFIFDVTTHSLMGQHEHRVILPGCCGLNTKTSSLPRYNEILENNMKVHRMSKRQDSIVAEIVDDTPMPAQNFKIETLDVQFIQLQKHAERKCRKTLKPNLEFSGPVKLWQERTQAYKALLHRKKGNPYNK